MAPKKAADAKKDEKKVEKPKKIETEEMKVLKEKEKALVKVPQPDRTELDANSEKIQTSINGLQEKLKAINEQIGAKSAGKEEHFKARDEIRAKLDEYQTKIDALEGQRTKIQGGIQAKQKESRDKRNELNDMKKKLGFESAGEIDAKIREIEVEMMTGSMTLKKEKEMMAKMTELRKSKPMVAKYADMEGNMGAVDVGSMKDNVGDIQKQLGELRDAKKLQSQAYAKLVEARQKVMGDVPALFEEREKINSSIREKIQDRNGQRDEFNKLQREYSSYLSEVRALRGERGRIEREERNKEWDQQKKLDVEDAGPAALPFAEDLQYLDNIEKYLKSNLAPEAAKKEEEKKAEVPDAVGGHMVLMSKKDREEEFFYAPTKKKNLTKKGPGKAKPIIHTMETLSFFDKYKLPTPADSSAIPAALEAVTAKIAEFKAKQEKKVEDDKKKAEKKEKGEKDEPAAEAAAEEKEAAPAPAEAKATEE